MTDKVEGIDADLQWYLSELVGHLASRDACAAIGFSPHSFTSLKALCVDYGVDIPQRVNQHTDNTYDFDPDDTQESYERVIEIRPDKSQYSDMLVRMTEEQAKDEEFVLRAHGYDPNKWELITSTLKTWQMASKRTSIIYTCPKCKTEGSATVCEKCGEEATKNVITAGHDVSTLYASKIVAKPLRGRFDIDEIVAKLQTVTPLFVSVAHLQDAQAWDMLEIPLFDLHFGLADLEFHQDTLRDIVGIINEHTREEILLPIGSDLFHHDNFKSATSNGTVLEDIDWTRTWADVATFYSTIIEASIAMALSVKVVYVKGNHDESMSWAFCQMLAAKYPQVTFDLEITERKMHVYHDVHVGFTHGDKAGKDIDRTFIAEFAGFAGAAIKEIHTGHYHHEVVKDQFGVIIRKLAAKNVTDKWTSDKGWVGSCKRFQVFEYGTNTLDGIRYV